MICTSDYSGQGKGRAHRRKLEGSGLSAKTTVHGHGPTIHLKRPLGHRWREKQIPISFASVIIIESSGRLSNCGARLLAPSLARSDGSVEGVEWKWNGDFNARPSLSPSSMIYFFPNPETKPRLPTPVWDWYPGCPLSGFIMKYN